MRVAVASARVGIGVESGVASACGSTGSAMTAPLDGRWFPGHVLRNWLSGPGILLAVGRGRPTPGPAPGRRPSGSRQARPRLSRMSSMARWPPALRGAPSSRLGYQRRGQLLDRRDVDRAVVQVVFDLGEMGGKEAAVGADRVPGQGHRARLGHMGPDEFQRGWRRPPRG